MATLSELGGSGPAGDFYAWVLKRYQRVILWLVILFVVMLAGAVAFGLWFGARLSALEEGSAKSVPVVVQTPSGELRRALDAQSARIVAIEEQMKRTAACQDRNLVALNKALQRLVLGRLGAEEFVSGFKLRSCR